MSLAKLALLSGVLVSHQRLNWERGWKWKGVREYFQLKGRKNVFTAASASLNQVSCVSHLYINQKSTLSARTHAWGEGKDTDMGGGEGHRHGGRRSINPRVYRRGEDYVIFASLKAGKKFQAYTNF